MRTPPLRVFWIEDSADDVDLFGLAIQRCQIEITLEVKFDGQEGLDHLMALTADSGKPDLILLDLNLPRKNGREVLTEIKRSEFLRTIPVVIFTTSNFDADIVTSYRNGAACYLVKPDQFERFSGVIKKLFEFWQEVETGRP
jgi:CheY-like chemotaxis protein